MTFHMQNLMIRHFRHFIKIFQKFSLQFCINCDYFSLAQLCVFWLVNLYLYLLLPKMVDHIVDI